MKLNSPAKNPSIAPFRGPCVHPIMITGTIANVATTGPIGKDPKNGTKHTNASIPRKIAINAILKIF